MDLNDVPFIVFLVLKLTGLITWSWLWVTCPLWIGFVLLFILNYSRNSKNGTNKNRRRS